MAKKATGSKETFEALRETSSVLISSMVERVRALQPDAGTLRLATPSSWSDMVFAFGYMLEQAGTELEDELQGSGLQSVLMLETLQLIDQDYFQKFGWRQAALWAIEEPESSLHTSLEVQVGALLQQIATVPRSRLQIICTTHSDLILQYADRSLFAQGTAAGTEFVASANKREILERAAKAGVSRWVHPILYYPLDPLILVEGEHDRVFLEEAFRVLRLGRRVRVADLEVLSGSGGGVDGLLSYVKANTTAIKARVPDSPVVVVLDWDAAGKTTQFTKLFAAGDPIHVVAWQEGEANPVLGASFRGVERFYPDRLIDAAEEAGHAVAQTKNGVRSVEKHAYGPLKRWLSERIASDGLASTDLHYAEPFLKRLLELCGV